LTICKALVTFFFLLYIFWCLTILKKSFLFPSQLFQRKSNFHNLKGTRQFVKITSTGENYLSTCHSSMSSCWCYSSATWASWRHTTMLSFFEVPNSSTHLIWKRKTWYEDQLVYSVAPHFFLIPYFFVWPWFNFHAYNK